MRDTRLTTVVDDVDDLLSVVDIDEVAEIETLLMALFDRSFGVERGERDDDGAASALDILTIGSPCDFPISVMEMVRSCAEAVDELGPFTENGAAPSAPAPDVLTMSDAELTDTLQQALGTVRLFNLLDSAD